MADCDDATRRALVELNMHCITKEMYASHIVMFMNSMAGKTRKLSYRKDDRAMYGSPWICPCMGAMKIFESP